MNTKDKANTTKETLEYARCVLEFVEGDQKGPAESVIELIEAAIPLAELEGQAVKLLKDIVDMQTMSPLEYAQSRGMAYMSDAYWDDKIEKCTHILTQIEALKAKDGTVRAT